MSLRDEIDMLKNSNHLLYPKILQVEITNRCPFQCPQCYKDIYNMKDMDWNLLKNLIKEAHEIGVKSIMINGGEPLIYEYFVDFIRLLTSLGMYGYCFTSGYGINEQFINDMMGQNISISISLNGSTEKINSLSRDGYAQSIKALALLKKCSLPFGINWVARADNVHDFPNMIRLGEQYGASWINVIANKMGCDGKLNSPMTRADYQLLSTYIKEYPHKNFIRIENCFSLLKVYGDFCINSSIKGCHAAIDCCSVDIDGNFMPCSHLQYKERYPTIYEYWNHSEILEKLRNMNSSEKSYCKDCLHNKNCRFCLAVSISTHNDFSVGIQNCPVREVSEHEV